ncbi:MAG: ABC transporter substrate-binding protein [Bacillota bacterium]
MAIVAVVGLLLGALPAHAAEGQPLTAVRLSEVVRSVFYAPQYVALALGFFEKEGLKVELSTAQGADKGMAALLSGTVDIGFFGPEAAVYVYLRGAQDHAVGFAQLTARDGSFLMAREATPNFSWTDLKGKTVVGGRKGGVPEMVLEWIIRQHGLEPHKDVRIITNLAFEAAPGAFEAGLGDYIAQFEPTMTAMEKRGIGRVVASLGVDGGEITYTVYHARKSYMQRNPDVIQRFTNAIYRGQLWVQGHAAEEIAGVVAPFFPAMDRDVLVRTIQRYKDQRTWRLTPVISEKGFERLLEVMQAAGELQGSVSFDAIMTNRFSERAVAEVSEP